MGANFSRSARPFHLVIANPIENIHNAQQMEDPINYKLVRKFIRTCFLAPFYTGLCDPPKDYHPSSETFWKEWAGENTSKTQPWDFETIAARLAERIGRPKHQDQQALYEQLTECPICLLYYPVFINYSRCCRQPICTDCFVRLKRSASHQSPSPSCPFCVQPDFGVFYVPPPSSHSAAFRQRRYNLLLNRQTKLGLYEIDVIYLDQIRSDWGIVTGSLAINGSTRRTIVRPDHIHTDSSMSSTRAAVRSENDSITGVQTIWEPEDILVIASIRALNCV